MWQLSVTRGIILRVIPKSVQVRQLAVTVTETVCMPAETFTASETTEPGAPLPLTGVEVPTDISNPYARKGDSGTFCKR
mgnify:CR=1 FL=1